jgi:predicted outer membrane repeat protein
MDYDSAKLHNACRVYKNETVEGGGIYYQNGEFNGTNYVYNNSASKNGGGVYVFAKTNKLLQGLVIGSDSIYNKTADTTLGNKAVLGGGVYTVAQANAATITLNNCEIIYNQLKSSVDPVPIDTGGGLYMSETKNETQRDYAVKLTGGTIIGHNHAKDGGGVYVSNDSNAPHQLTLELINTTLRNNIAYNYGGGIYNDKQTVTSANNVSTITFHGNSTVKRDGGGIYNEGQVLLTGTYQHIFTKNIAADHRGGGIFNKSTCSLKNCQIGQSGNGNEAKSGGGIFVEGGATTTLLAGVITFEGNKA